MLKSISLTHFKNYTGQTVVFSDGLNFVVGQNGMGKTNLLDAVYYLCMAKSHSTPHDRDTVQFEAPFFRIEAEAHMPDNDHRICVKVKPGAIKDIAVDGKSIGRLSAYIGMLPVIMLAPEDIALIEGGSVTRRRFMDVALCQADRAYLDHLQRYNKLLAQRNALLRSDGLRADRTLLMTYTEAMTEPAAEICRQRASLTGQLLPMVMQYYAQLSDTRETPGMQYTSHCEAHSLHDLAIAGMEADLQIGRTTKGVHRDDLDLLLDGYAVRKFGSQGQIKSLLIAMHLAQAAFLKDKTGMTPVLLLDDIFDRLDEDRTQRLIMLLAAEPFGQILISDASPRRVQHLIALSACPARVLEIRQGEVTGVHDHSGSSNLHDHDAEE